MIALLQRSLRSVLDASGSAGHGRSYHRNLESLLAFVSTCKQPRAERRIPHTILGGLPMPPSGADQEQAAAMIDELLQFVDNRSGISEAGHLST